MIKIPELAKKINMDPKTLVFKLKDAGFPINTVKSKLNDEIVNYALENFASKKKKKKSKTGNRKENLPQEKEKNVIYYNENATIEEIAEMINKSTSVLIKDLMMLGVMANKNQTVDRETLELIVGEYGYEVKDEISTDISHFENIEIVDKEEDLVSRPPVVTIMGHVDHGKTTLLDTIRSSKIISGEFGGITQHIGAYQVVRNGKTITFIDTPGHAAFSEMRARGAQVTDIIILVVAADDGVMPQTREAIDHAKASKVPVIVAVNKMDKPQANPERVMTELSELGIVPEAWGGDTIFCNISALTGMGVGDLLENILALAELNEYKANPNRLATGTVIEARQDKSMGSIATLLVQNGSMQVRDIIVVGENWGHVRTMKDDMGNDIENATPSTPVEISGLDGTPRAGDKFMVFADEKEARKVADARKYEASQKQKQQGNIVNFANLFDKLSSGEEKELNVIVKCDVSGSAEAIKGSIANISVDGAKINVIRCSPGTVTETDVTFALASNAVIIGFNVRPPHAVRALAEEQGVEIRLYNVIYNIVDDLTAAIKGMLEPVFVEQVIGEATVRQIFKASKVGTIAGCYVNNGCIKRDCGVRLIRDGIVVYEGKLSSLRRGKEDVKQVNVGYECGLTIENYNDIKVEDYMEFFEMIEEEQK